MEKKDIFRHRLSGVRIAAILQSAATMAGNKALMQKHLHGLQIITGKTNF